MICFYLQILSFDKIHRTSVWTTMEVCKFGLFQVAQKER